jgi:C4-dicarboxylate transporter DctM subunit
MEAWVIGLLGIGILLLLIGLRIHVAFALGAVGVGGYFSILGWRATEGLLGLVPYSFIASFVLTTIPTLSAHGIHDLPRGLTTDIYRVARLWLSRVPGGLAIASVAGCAAFAAASGSSLATAAMMGKAAIPEMMRHKYNGGLATGAVAAAGTIGSLIPPAFC